MSPDQDAKIRHLASLRFQRDKAKADYEYSEEIARQRWQKWRSLWQQCEDIEKSLLL